MAKKKKPQKIVPRKKVYKGYPRIYLNIQGTFCFLSFHAHSKPLSDAELQSAKEETPPPTRVCFAIKLKDIKHIVFDSDKKLTIHWKVAKYLLTNKYFKGDMDRRIVNHKRQLLKYRDRIAITKTQSEKKRWFKILKREKRKFDNIIQLRNSMYTAVRQKQKDDE